MKEWIDIGEWEDAVSENEIRTWLEAVAIEARTI